MFRLEARILRACRGSREAKLPYSRPSWPLGWLFGRTWVHLAAFLAELGSAWAPFGPKFAVLERQVALKSVKTNDFISYTMSKKGTANDHVQQKPIIT